MHEGPYRGIRTLMAQVFQHAVRELRSTNSAFQDTIIADPEQLGKLMTHHDDGSTSHRAAP